MRYARAKISDQHTADDLVQDTLLAALTGNSRFLGNSGLRTWLTSILNHKIIDTYRRNHSESARRVIAPADDDTMALDLTREVTRLRLALAAHNQLEETVLRPALSAADSFGEVRIDQMVDHHVAEHDTLRGQLDRLRVGDLRVTIASLRRHLEHEERTFLSPRVLRDDVVTVEGAG